MIIQENHRLSQWQ